MSNKFDTLAPLLLMFACTCVFTYQISISAKSKLTYFYLTICGVSLAYQGKIIYTLILSN